MTDSQKCPICNSEGHYVPRYRNYVCGNCIDTYGTYTKAGQKISFGNIDYWGGFKSKIEGEDNYGSVHECYINNLQCYADEAKFGGIVILLSRHEEERGGDHDGGG